MKSKVNVNGSIEEVGRKVKGVPSPFRDLWGQWKVEFFIHSESVGFQVDVATVGDGELCGLPKVGSIGGAVKAGDSGGEGSRAIDEVFVGGHLIYAFLKRTAVKPTVFAYTQGELVVQGTETGFGEVSAEDMLLLTEEDVVTLNATSEIGLG